MSVEENIGLMRRWFKEVWNEKRLETIHELLAPNAVGIGELEDGGKLQGPDEFATFAKRLHAAFPDIDVTVEDAFGAGDKVVLRWSANMTHSGDDLGMPASGERVHITGITIARIANGQIVEGWDNWDQLAMLKQIGAYQATQADLKKSA